MDRIMRLSLGVRLAETDGMKGEAKQLKRELAQEIANLPRHPGFPPLLPNSDRCRGLVEACLEVADAIMERTQTALEEAFSTMDIDDENASKAAVRRLN